MAKSTEIWIKNVNRTADVEQWEKIDRNLIRVKFRRSPKVYLYAVRDVCIKEIDYAYDDRWQALKKALIDFARSAEKHDRDKAQALKKTNQGAQNQTDAQGLSREAWGTAVTNLESIRHIPQGSVLENYIVGQTREVTDRPHLLIYPFGCNSSQKKAVENAFSKSLSVIQGPPGTGKTQTILNILANLLVHGKSAAVASNNNAATKNVSAKLEADCGLGWLVAVLGRSANRKAFFENLPEISLEKIPVPAKIPSNDELQRLSAAVDESYANRIRIQDLRDTRYRLDFQLREFFDDVQKRGLALKENEWFQWLKKKSSVGLDAFLALVRERQQNAAEAAGTLAKLWNGFRLFLNGVRGKRALAKLDREIEIVLDAVLAAQSTVQIEELDKQIDELNAWLDSHRSVEDDLIAASKAVFYEKIRTRFEPLANKKGKQWNESNFRKDAGFLKRFPIVTSSTYALVQSRPESGFDVLIIDEASQVNLPTAVASFACAGRAVVVGDSKQLPAILPDLEYAAKEHLLSAGFSDKEANALNPAKLSLLDSVTVLYGTEVPSTLLREHYRCNPDIIEFCNRMFYNGELVVMTSRGRAPMFKPLEWIRSERSLLGKIGGVQCKYTNERQILDIADACRKLKEEGIREDRIGVITPYRNQVKAVQMRVPGIEVDTVHAFQGREKDVIIYSAVLDWPTPFLENPKLLNVAVSRAKTRFILISSAFDDYADSLSASLVRYICRLDPQVRRVSVSKHRSVFDLLVRSDLDNVERKAGESPAEALFRGLLSKTLAQDERYRNWRFVQEYPLRLLPTRLDVFNDAEQCFMLNNARLDFLVFDRIDNTAVATFEIDGAAFHQVGTRQDERDRLKDGILQTLDIVHERFRTDDAPGGEEARLKALLEAAFKRRNPEKACVVHGQYSA